MKVNFGSYTYFDGNPSDGIYQGTKGVGATGQFAFDKEISI